MLHFGEFVRQKLQGLRKVVGTLPREIIVALVVTLVATVAAPPLLQLLTKDKVSVWVLVLVAGIVLLVGIAFGTLASGPRDEGDLRSKIGDLESRVDLLDAYAEHVRDALALLRRGLVVLC